MRYCGNLDPKNEGSHRSLPDEKWEPFANRKIRRAQKQFGYCHSSQPRAYPVFHVEGFTEVTLPSHCYIGADLHLLGKHGVGFVKQPRKAGGGLMQPHSLDGRQRNRQGPFGVPRRPPFPVVRHTLLVGHTPNLRWRYRSTR
jgi:hypothetical protein